MAHGPDTKKLFRRIKGLQNNTLDTHNLNITSLPILPLGLKILDCSFANISSLPILPSGLEELWCYNTPLTSLPELPSSLEVLLCHNTLISSLPELPSSLKELYCWNTPLLLQRGENESIKDYNARWRVLREELASKDRCQERCRQIKDDLIAEVMHPRRIERLLEMGGWEALECF
jgi:hypothetical protein